MSDRRPTYLSSLFEASVMDRWSERYLSTRVLYLLILLPFAWEWPDTFTRDDWGTLDFKVWAWLTFIGTILWQMYRSWRKLWEMKEAYHHLEEERLKKVAPNQITINDNDGIPRKPVSDFGATRGDADPVISEWQADLLRNESNDFDPRHGGPAEPPEAWRARLRKETAKATTSKTIKKK